MLIMVTTNKSDRFSKHQCCFSKAFLLVVLLTSCGPVKPAVSYNILGYWEAKPTSISISCCLNEEMNEYAASLKGLLDKKILHCSPLNETPSNNLRLDWTEPYYDDSLNVLTAGASFWWDVSGFMNNASWNQEGNTFEITFYCDDVDPSRWLVFFFTSYSRDTISLSICSSPKSDEHYVCPSTLSASNSEVGCVAPPSHESRHSLLSINYRYVS